MFDITNDEKLRDAYALLMFMQKDVPASSKKKANVKNLAATVKREIRSYNNRPASNSCMTTEIGLRTESAFLWMMSPTGCLTSQALNWRNLKHESFDSLRGEPRGLQGFPSTRA